MAGTRKRVQRTISRAEANNQYLISAFKEFIAEKKALGRVNDTLKSYQTTYKKFMDYFGDEAEETGNIVGSMFIEWTNAMRDRVIAAYNGEKGGTRNTINYAKRCKIEIVNILNQYENNLGVIMNG